MPRAKVYPGRRVINKRWGGRKMYQVASYWSGKKKVGIYSDTFDQFIKMLADRTKHNQQNVVNIEGNTGSGKSTLAIQMCIALAKKLGKDFDLKKDYIYSVDDLWRKLQDPNASPVSLIDEAVLVINAKRSQSKDSVDVVNLFNTMRSRGWSTFLCEPTIFQINKEVRCTHIDFNIHCSSNDDCPLPGFGRGIFEVSKAVRSRYKRDSEPYWLLLTTGVFKELPKKVDLEYQPIKQRAQELLIADMIKRRGGATT